MNGKMLNKIRAAARRAGYYERNKDDFGRTVETYNGIALMDAGKYYSGSATQDIIDTVSYTHLDVYKRQTVCGALWGW